MSGWAGDGRAREKEGVAVRRCCVWADSLQAKYRVSRESRRLLARSRKRGLVWAVMPDVRGWNMYGEVVGRRGRVAVVVLLWLLLSEENGRKVDACCTGIADFYEAESKADG
jgi:hypothetical protein